MASISFTSNWNNKLSCSAFTTLRLHNPIKYVAGQRYTIELNGKVTGEAVLIEKRTISYSQLNEFVCYIDSGYSKKSTIEILKRMYPRVEITQSRFDLCLLAFVRKNKRIANNETPQLRLPYKD